MFSRLQQFSNSVSSSLSFGSSCCFRSKLPIYIATPEPLHTDLSTNISTTTSMSMSMNSLTASVCTPTWENTIPFVAPITSGYVIKVYDGDTITVASKLPYPESPLYRFAVRLNGIDCPEIKSKVATEKQLAKIAQEKVSELILNKMIRLENVTTEKYGRLLADVFIGDLHLNAFMIESRLAVKYDGGTKKSPSDWMEFYLKG